MTSHTNYMKRTFDLAKNGSVLVSPNPKVGAIIVNNDKIIGEGFHKKHGFSHAEVHAVKSVSKHNKKHIKNSDIYVSLEPCCITGKTPPCTTLIISQKIKQVHFSTLDATAGVNGKSQPILEKNNIIVKSNILKTKGNHINKYRNTYVTKKRPFITLKIALSANGYIGQKDEQIWLTNPQSKILVHKWRSEHSAILVGKTTILIDNPDLSNREYCGLSPTRLVLDKNLDLPKELKIFNKHAKTIIYTQKEIPGNYPNNITQEQIPYKNNILELLNDLYKKGMNSIFVEGGSKLIQSFVDQGLWDQLYTIQSPVFIHKNGIKAPQIDDKKLISKKKLLDNTVLYYINPKTQNY